MGDDVAIKLSSQLEPHSFDIHDVISYECHGLHIYFLFGFLLVPVFPGLGHEISEDELRRFVVCETNTTVA